MSEYGLRHPDIVIAEHFDPLNLTPGGIDSIISDIVKFSEPHTSIVVVGISADPETALGKWRVINFAGRQIEFLPVSVVDRASSNGRLKRLPHSLQFAFGLLKHRRKLPSATYHTHRIETGFLINALRRGRLVQFIHNDSRGLLGASSDSKWKRLAGVYRALENSVIKKATRVVLFNKTDSARLRKLRSDLIVSRTWFDSDIFDSHGLGRAREQSHDEIIRICWVGRLDSQKDPILAIEVLKSLKDNGDRPLLTFVGDGILGPAIKKTAVDLGVANELVMLGSQTRTEVAAVMSQSDVLLMTSQYEGSPVVLLEAGACGLPVVATEESDPDGALIAGSNGERVSERTATELASAIRRAKHYDRAMCRQMAESRSGRTSVLQLMETIGN